MKNSRFVVAGILLALVLGYSYWNGILSKKISDSKADVASVNPVTPKSAAPIHEGPGDVVRRIREAVKERKDRLQANSERVAVGTLGERLGIATITIIFGIGTNDRREPG